MKLLTKKYLVTFRLATSAYLLKNKQLRRGFALLRKCQNISLMDIFKEK